MGPFVAGNAFLWNLYKFGRGSAPFVFGKGRDYFPDMTEKHVQNFEKNLFFKNRETNNLRIV